MVLTGTAGSSALNVEASSLASLLLCLVIRACVRVRDFELTSTEHKLSVGAQHCTRQVLCLIPFSFFSFFFHMLLSFKSQTSHVVGSSACVFMFN